MIHAIRGLVMPVLAVILLASLALGAALHPFYYWGAWISAPLLALGVWDLFQRQHSILRTYPVLGHLRFLLEDSGPELHQYFVESNTSGAPFNRDMRSLIYQRAKGVEDKKPFGTEWDVYAEGYSWINHSMQPRPEPADPARQLRVLVGGPGCQEPYSASVYNISAMSFGSLSGNAIEALNRGAARGGFAHCTGEGGVSSYHRLGGDLIWQIGTGYFGCRRADGGFDAERFAEVASDDRIKMIELKLSQGAKPGHGGILPGAKVTREIAKARGIPVGEDCVSPAWHTAFSTPIGLLEFIEQLRGLAGGKPVGFKLCVGDLREFFCVCKAMLETQILPDFITVDGAEGGTGAAPIEFTNHLGVPLREGLQYVHNSLVGIGVRDRLRLAASAKLTTAFSIARAMALGADWCNSARGFMFALGCIQARRCHTNTCPVGVATQNPLLSRALAVSHKELRVYNFHSKTVQALAEFCAAVGLDHPAEIKPAHVLQRVSPTEIQPLDRLYSFYRPGQLLDGQPNEDVREFWEAARADRYEVV